eukprot:CAMPEP_0197824454 /NCGR_PEP_ID=MMETSP1437-20131217/1689_1 /TAXON_ID=49252 ORGANISM="Eucampia antarctica, Strain CCMP1452" /NCGR_SAMPLE_ID=MMETSP1437 /ASSEMBLY_ACC=CAM_ASM_001096 /LENGTH=1549 /DNA_ID=CAMNT_0043424079 /DNA_START=140 /DNA_END=4789 /DNA_ORIENTATION=+
MESEDNADKTVVVKEDNGAREENEDTFLSNLAILPPLQKNHNDFGMQDAIVLPPIRPEEPVQSIRAALSEVCGYAHITNYRLEFSPSTGVSSKNGITAKNTNSAVEPSSTKKKGKKKNKKNKNNSNNSSTVSSAHKHSVVSKYTGPNAVVHLRSNEKNVAPGDDTQVLDDYGDLTTLKELGSNSYFKIVLETYDIATLRDHVRRTRYLLEDGNAPHVSSLVVDDNTQTINDDDSQQNMNHDSSNDVAENETTKLNKNDDNTQSINEPKEKTEKELEEEEKKKRQELAKKLPAFALESPVVVDGSNLEDFFYLACGEEAAMKCFHDGDSTNTKKDYDNNTKSVLDVTNRLNELENIAKVSCNIAYSGFNPPPSNRRILGDLAYLEVKSAKHPNELSFFITCIPTGFYVNKTFSSEHFDPTPAPEACFSHTLLDCILQKSKSTRNAWIDALVASKERAQLNSPPPSTNENPLQALFRLAIRGDMTPSNHKKLSIPTISTSTSLDTVLLRPSWLVPFPRTPNSEPIEYKHEYNPTRAEDDLNNTFGLDIRGGSLRDWNEEIQSTREMPTENLQQRLDRAKLMHKVLSDFGEAALAGAMAVTDGSITPMNPNEPTRSHVYVHNNIFFSRALDAGVDTFKITEGDRAARKAANRDAQCVGTLHRLDVSGLHTLATVIVDFLGSRLVCQSLVPGILHGEKTHKLLYGAVEATSPLVWDEEMQTLLEENLGKGLMVATRTVPTSPFTSERLEEIRKMRPILAHMHDLAIDNVKEDKNGNETISICGPVEAKGILGSDQRKYLLDLSRLTPRDANWVPKSQGGSGHWESITSATPASSQKPAMAQSFIPASLEDNEWTMAVLRPELITNLTHKKMREWLQARKKGEKASSEEAEDSVKNQTKVGVEKILPEKKGTEDTVCEKSTESTVADPPEELHGADQKNNPEAQNYLKSLRMNINVFLPHMKTLENIDKAAFEQISEDEEKSRDAASFLWENVLPSLSKEMRQNLSHQIPPDGKSLTELLHQRGMNCRYLGRLATLAVEEEAKDLQAEKDVASGKPEKLPRKAFPECWLELLECEMVARAAKHVLDSYFVENGGSVSAQPAQLVASFLSALMMTSEESAAETEHRVSKDDGENHFDDDYFNGLTMFNVGGDGDAIPPPVRDRGQVWNDIENEIGRRFRYDLTLHNRKEVSRRVQYIPLLRRICQRSGIRLLAKNYKVGDKGLCSAGPNTGGRISDSYPIQPVDVVDVLPMVKNAASIAGESFVPCVPGAVAIVPLLHVLLPDAKATFEAAHLHFNVGSLPQALEYVQEAANLYQRVVDTPLHTNVSRCLDLTAVVLFQANEMELAATNAARALAVAVQLGGFDCTEAVTAHSTMSHIHITSGNLTEGINHLRASIYLQELLAGKNSPELSNLYHKIGTLYHEFGGLINALRFYQEAANKRNYDRMAESMILKSMALLLANLGHFKAALDTEKRAHNVYRLTLGEDHELTKNSANTLKHFMKLAVEQGSRQVEEERKRQDELAADAIADEIVADEAAEDSKKKKKKKSKKKKAKS